jgi:MFS family permease
MPIRSLSINREGSPSDCVATKTSSPMVWTMGLHELGFGIERAKGGLQPHVRAALGLATVPALTGVTVTLVGVSLVAVAGVASPAITYWTSVAAGDHQGQELGRWTAATSLGQAVGSASAGLLMSQGFNLAVFAFSAVASAIGMLLALPLAGKLARPNVDHNALARIAPGRPR